MADKNLPDLYLQRTHRLIRVAEGEAIAEATKLAKLHEKILKKIDIEKLSAAGLKILNAEISSLIVDYYKTGVIPRHEQIFREVMDREIKWNSEILSGISIGSATVPNSAKVAQSAFKKKYQGKSFSTWFTQLGATNSRKITSTLKSAYINGLSNRDARIQIENIMQRQSKDIKTLVRSSLTRAGTIAREQVSKENQDIVSGKTWISTLDIRTTLICAVRDNKDYDNDDNPIGHSELWEEGPGAIHFNCRSTFIPLLKGEEKIEIPRPAISAGRDYERGDNKTRIGTVRKPTKPNREKGIFKIEQVSSRTDYQSWLKRQPTSFVADALGSREKARLFKSGELSIEDLQSFKPMRAKNL